MTTPSVSREDQERFLRRLCREIEQRIKSGESQVVESYFFVHPELQEDADAAIELIYTEYLAREEEGRPPSLDELRERFPLWRVRLERLLDVDSALSPKTSPALTLDAGSTWNGNKLTNSATNPAPPRAQGPLHKRIGQYELLEEIGSGGMGIVYRARQFGLNRTVALKVIQAGNTTENQRARFRAEAQSVALLQHPNIIQVYEIGEQQDTHFISLEFAAQGSLDRKLAAGTFPFRAAAETTETLARAVALAHERGIVHRDLKPANVLVTADGTLKLTDFGLAKSFLDPSQRQTLTGAILGTPCYMAPEQADGRNADVGPSTDIYALGCMLYEFLTGHPPFVGNTALETLEQIRSHEPVPPSRLRKGLPRDLETICLRCLRKESGSRYASAELLADDLRRFLEHEPILARPVGMLEKMGVWTRRNKSKVLLALMFLTFAVTGSYTTWLLIRLNSDKISTEHKAALIAEIAEKSKTEAELAKSLAQLSQTEAATSKVEAETSKSEKIAAIEKAKELLDRHVRQSEALMWHPGMGKIGQPALEMALKHYRDLLRGSPNDLKLKQQAARAFIWAGHFQREYGDFQKSQEHVEEGCQLWKTLVHRFPNELAYRYGLADGLIELGHLQRYLNHQERSIRTYREAVEILEEMLRKSPGNVDYLDLLGLALLNMSIPIQNLESHEQSENEIRRAIQLQWQAITTVLETELKRSGGPRQQVRIVAPWQDSTDDSELFSGIRQPDRSLADTRTSQNQHLPKIPVLRKAPGYQVHSALPNDNAQLIRQSPGAPIGTDASAHKFNANEPVAIPFKQLKPTILTSIGSGALLPNLTLSLERLGSLRALQRRYQESEAAYRVALDLRELTVLYGGTNATRLEFLARSHLEIAACEVRNRQVKKAEFHFRKAIDILTGLEQQYPEWMVYRMGVANGQWQFAKFLVTQNAPEAAEALYRKALDRFQTLQKETTGVRYFRRYVSMTFCELAYARYLQGHSGDAYRLVWRGLEAEVFYLNAYYDLCWYVVADLKQYLQQQQLSVQRPRATPVTNMNYPLWKSAREIFDGRASPRPRSLDHQRHPDQPAFKMLQALLAWKLNQPVSAVRLLNLRRP